MTPSLLAAGVISAYDDVGVRSFAQGIRSRPEHEPRMEQRAYGWLVVQLPRQSDEGAMAIQMRTGNAGIVEAVIHIQSTTSSVFAFATHN